MPRVGATDDFRVLSRRRWLKWALGGGGALLMGGGGGLFALRGRAADVPGLKVLSPHEYRTMAALAQALLPRGGPFEAGGEDVDLARQFDGYLADEPKWGQDDAKSALFLLEFGPVFFERRLSTFSHLSPAERLTHYEAWARSGTLLRRQVALGFRKFFSLVFYDSPSVWSALAYEGPLIQEPAP